MLNLIAALTSILGLQTAMIAQFSAQDEAFRMRMNAVTGAVVFVSVIFAAAFML